MWVCIWDLLLNIERSVVGSPLLLVPLVMLLSVLGSSTVRGSFCVLWRFSLVLCRWEEDHPTARNDYCPGLLVMDK